MSTRRDYYQILGIHRNATLDQIRKAYREAALKNHPDRVPEIDKKSAEEKFKEISEAYAVLSDPQKRELYDQYGHQGIDQKYTYEDIFKGTDFSTIFKDLSEFGLGENLFDQIFGNFGFDISERYKKEHPYDHDLQIALEITLEEAAQGCEKNVCIPKYNLCSLCHGSGAEPGSQVTPCFNCKGKGKVISTQAFMHVVQTCSECNGTGTVLTTTCPKCQGKGRVKIQRQLNIKIPPGIDSGSQLRIRNEGESKQSNLYVVIEIKPHPVFKRKGDDLIIHLAIPLSKAVLGGEISVPTLFKKITMKIPPGTQNGTKFRIKGKGMPKINQHTYGDEYVIISVDIPTHLTLEQRQLMEAFAKLSKEAA